MTSFNPALRRMLRQLICLSLSAALILMSSLPSAHAVQTDDRKKSARVESLTPPPEIGSVVDAHITSEDPKSQLVVQIQDLHANYGVQTNIVKLLEFLDSRLGEGNYRVAVEGAQGPISITELARIADHDLKTKVCDRLMKDAELTGTEYFSIVRGRPNLLWGVEDQRYHHANIALFQATYRGKQQLARTLSQLQSDLQPIKEKFYSRVMRKLDQKAVEYAKGQTDLAEYTTHLVRQASRQGIPIAARYPETARWTGYSKAAQYANLDKLMTEQTDLLKDIQMGLASSKIQRNIAAAAGELDVLRRMLIEEITTEEIRRLTPQLSSVVGRVKHLLESSGMAYDKDNLGEVVNSSLDFYAVALLRDQFLAENTLKIIQEPESKIQHIVLVAGGFHTPGISSYLKGKGVSYITITPAVDSHDDKDKQLYVAKLMGHHAVPSDILVGNTSLSWALNHPLTKWVAARSMYLTALHERGAQAAGILLRDAGPEIARLAEQPRPVSLIEVDVLIPAPLEPYTQSRQVVVNVPAGSTRDALIGVLVSRYPRLQPHHQLILRDTAMYSPDGKLLAPDDPVFSGPIGIVPAVSGGVPEELDEPTRIALGALSPNFSLPIRHHIIPLEAHFRAARTPTWEEEARLHESNRLALLAPQWIGIVLELTGMRGIAAELNPKDAVQKMEIEALKIRADLVAQAVQDEVARLLKFTLHHHLFETKGEVPGGIETGHVNGHANGRPVSVIADVIEDTSAFAMGRPGASSLYFEGQGASAFSGFPDELRALMVVTNIPRNDHVQGILRVRGQTLTDYLDPRLPADEIIKRIAELHQTTPDHIAVTVLPNKDENGGQKEVLELGKLPGLTINVISGGTVRPSVPAFLGNRKGRIQVLLGRSGMTEAEWVRLTSSLLKDRGAFASYRVVHPNIKDNFTQGFIWPEGDRYLAKLLKSQPGLWPQITSADGMIFSSEENLKGRFSSVYVFLSDGLQDERWPIAVNGVRVSPPTTGKEAGAQVHMLEVASGGFAWLSRTNYSLALLPQKPAQASHPLREGLLSLAAMSLVAIGAFLASAVLWVAVPIAALSLFEGAAGYRRNRAVGMSFYQALMTPGALSSEPEDHIPAVLRAHEIGAHQWLGVGELDTFFLKHFIALAAVMAHALEILGLKADRPFEDPRLQRLVQGLDRLASLSPFRMALGPSRYAVEAFSKYQAEERRLALQRIEMSKKYTSRAA
jgi:hypothetical protein